MSKKGKDKVHTIPSENYTPNLCLTTNGKLTPNEIHSINPPCTSVEQKSPSLANLNGGLIIFDEPCTDQSVPEFENKNDHVNIEISIPFLVTPSENFKSKEHLQLDSLVSPPPPKQ